MATARRVVPAVLLLVLAGGVALTWRLFGDRPNPIAAPARPVAAEVGAPEHGEPSASAEVSRSRDVETGRDVAVVDESPPSFPATRRKGALVVEIVDRIGAPVAGAEARIDSWIGGHFADLALADDRDVHRRSRADDAGRIEIAALAEGAYCITARADDGRSAREYLDFSLAHGDPVLRITLSNEPQRPPGVEITVVGADGSPVADSQVALYGATFDHGLVGTSARPALEAKSDATGVARFDGVRWSSGMVVAKTPDGRMGAKAFGEILMGDITDEPSDLESLVASGNLVSVSSDDDVFARLRDSASMVNGFDFGAAHHPTSQDFSSMKLVVRKPGRITGTIEPVPGAALADGVLAGASIEAWIATTQNTWESSHGFGTTVPVAGRSFAFDMLPAGEYALVLHAPGGARLVLDRSKDGEEVLENSLQPPLAKIEEGATAQVTLHVTAGGTIHGRVHRADGTPVAGARIVATFGPWRFVPCDAFVRHGMHVWSFGPDSGLEGLHPLTHVVARTDVRGEYRLTGLQPGLHRIMVTARGLSFDRREWTGVSDGKTLELDHVLEDAGAIQGIAASDAYLGVTRVGEPTPVAIATLLEGRSFTFGGLRPGEYLLSDFADERGTPPVERGRATVEAGRTTFVDLTDAPGPVEISGQVVDGHGGVATATVEFESMRRRVGGDGSFTFHSSFPPGGLVFAIQVETEQLRETFSRRLDVTTTGAAWHGSLRLGDESLRVEVCDTAGNPFAGTVELWRTRLRAEGDAPQQIRTRHLPLDMNGSLTIEHLFAGHYDLRVIGPDGFDLASKVELPRDHVLRLEFEQGGNLVVHVVGGDGHPLPFWKVTASTFIGEGEPPDDFADHDEWVVTRTSVTLQDGVARLNHVRSGRVVIRAEKNGFFGQDGSVETNGAAEAPTPVERELRRGETLEVELRATTSAKDER